MHLSIEDAVDHLRVDVTTEPQLRFWVEQRSRSYPYRFGPNGEPSSLFARHLGYLRYVNMPAILLGINSYLDKVLLGRSRNSQSAYGPSGFTWIPPDGPFDFRTRAYRDIRKADIAAAGQSWDLVEIINELLWPPAYIRRATAEVTFH